jgi:Helix-turn-helix domain
MSKRNMEDHERAGMIESLQCNRPNEPTEFVAPDRGQKQLSCYAVASLRLRGVSKEQVASVMAVLIWLIKHANPTTGRCDPGINKLAFETGLGEKTIRRAIKIAEDIGYLSVEPRIGHTSAYHLDFHTMEADFYDIEEQAKNLPRSCMTGPPVSADRTTPVNTDRLKHKEESLEEKAYHKVAHPPSAADAAYLGEKEKRFSEETVVRFSANPTETAARQRVDAYVAANPFVRGNLPSSDAVERAVAAELGEEGSGRAIINKAANDTWRARRTA